MYRSHFVNDSNVLFAIDYYSKKQYFYLLEIIFLNLEINVNNIFLLIIIITQVIINYNNNHYQLKECIRNEML